MEGGQARIQVYIIEGRPVLARSWGTASVPSGFRLAPKGGGARAKSSWSSSELGIWWANYDHNDYMRNVNKKKRQHNFFYRFSLSHTFRGEGRVSECKKNNYLAPFPFLVKLSHFFICHYVTWCFIFRSKHSRVGITVLMTTSSSFMLFLILYSLKWVK